MRTEIVKGQELAEWLGVALTTVQRLAQEGKIPKAGRNRYNLAECVAAYCEALRATAAKAGGRPPGDGAPVNLSNRDRLNAAQADLAELKLAQQRGEMVPTAAVARAWQGVLQTVRAGVLAIPSRCSARLGALSAHDISEIEAECRAVLEELADG